MNVSHGSSFYLAAHYITGCLLIIVRKEPHHDQTCGELKFVEDTPPKLKTSKVGKEYVELVHKAKKKTDGPVSYYPSNTLH